MRASRMCLATLREDPADAEIASHRLLMRAGFLHKSGAGLYLYGPLMHRVIEKIQRIVAEEITAAGGQQVTMPILQEEQLWQQSGRWEGYKATRTMLTTTDRGGQTYGLAPTAEEVVTAYTRAIVSSYKQLPVCFFQQHTKFRDEIRPRFGLMRVKEFIMMDAYSFHADDESLDTTYRAMHDAYVRAFTRLGLESFAVDADTGAIGGKASHEFMVAASVGEDAILLDGQGYAANIEKAVSVLANCPRLPVSTARQSVLTPKAGAIEDVVASLKSQGFAVESANLLKCMLFMASTAEGTFPVAAVVRGDRSVNEAKLARAATESLNKGTVHLLRPMHPEEVQTATGAAVGFAGPAQGLKVQAVILDRSLQGEGRWVCGANQTDYHIVGFDLAEVKNPFWTDLTLAQAGDIGPNGAVLTERRGIEVGHIFKLGTKYSEPMGATFTAADGSRKPMIMGCYGIGSSRLAAAAVEQHNDNQGIKWPMAIAPYHCVVVVPKPQDAVSMQAAEKLYTELKTLGVETILDERDCNVGVKFKDWELIGIPLRLVVGRSLAKGLVEMQERGKQAVEVPVGEAAAKIRELVKV